MKSKVYFIDFRTNPKQNMFKKLENLLDVSEFSKTFSNRDIVAIKLHFGELGNLAYIRPNYLRKIVELVKKNGGNPFLTDANTLYAGTRSDAPNHIQTAIFNGFDYAVVGAPLIIADGLRGKTETAVTINGTRFKKVYIGTEIIQADALISVAHFKGHELSGFGGAIKNVGMGCASRRGKLAQHSTVSPKISKKKCVGCGDCIDHCSQKAIELVDEKATIDQKKCIGCGECILICPNSAVEIQWDQAIPVFMENMVEYTLGVLKDKKDKAFFINFISDVSPACDCYGHNDSPIVRNIGITASLDPVAIDQACADLVNAESVLPECTLSPQLTSVDDKFKAIYPKVDWTIQLDYAEKIGLGSRSYELIRV